MAPDLTHRTLATNGIDMHVAEAGGSGPLVVLCHGFPELWSSWRHQIAALADAGYRVIAPDQRGYGGSTAPPAIEDYDMAQLTGDLVGLLDAVGEERAVFVGHDWGSMVVWNLALRHPDRVRAVIGMSVPASPRGPMQPTELMRQLFGDTFFYMLYFQQAGVADAELGADAKKTLRAFMHTISGDSPADAWKVLPAAGTGLLDSLTDTDEPIPWLPEDELDAVAAEFQRTGFTGGLNWYRNVDRNWKLGEAFEGRTIDMPSLFVAGEQDPVLLMVPPAARDGLVTDRRDTVIIPGAGHWIQQERPAEVNAALLGFLAGLGGNDASA
jgi:pimeloyl-ACP methyl ester carboxylesterase